MKVSSVINIDAIELNDQFKMALLVMESTERNVFITGRAGTGKSTLLEYFRAHTKKRIAVLAPTGVAALNVRGQTIHSFFRFPAHITLNDVFRQHLKDKDKDVIKNVQAIVIDEASMIRADLLDCVDAALRRVRNRPTIPFGGTQIIFIGDLYQLPPVVSGDGAEIIFKQEYKSPYFFDARVMSDLQLDLIELEKIYRQKDEIFINLLNKIRNNTIEDHDIEFLNAACMREVSNNEKFITLTPTNAAADVINQQKLAQLESKNFKYHGRIEGKFDRTQVPTAVDLELKSGARVMLLSNDQHGRWVNGSLGKIIKIKSGNKSTREPDALLIKLDSGGTVEVPPHTWEVYEYSYDRHNHSLEVDQIGSFTQYPVRLAWAVTIHKSQGKTFDKVIIDIGRGAFAHGQVYVALSRCRTLAGMIFKTPIKKHHIWMDWKVVKFVTEHQYKLSEVALPTPQKTKLIEQAIIDGLRLEITYLKSSDEKSSRVILPKKIGEMEYNGKKYLGIEAYCFWRHDTRVFRVDRILAIRQFARIGE